MRHLMMITVKNASYLAGTPPSDALQAAMGTLMGEWTAAGTLLSAEGLLPPSPGASLQLNAVTVNDRGSDVGEVIGGLFIVQTQTRDEALAMCRAFLQLHLDVMGPDFFIGCELRGLEG